MKKLKKENRKLRKKLTLCQHLIERLQRVNEGYKKIINQSSTPIMKPSEDDRGNTTNGGMVNSTRGIKRRRIEEATIIDRRSLSLSPNTKVKANPSTGLQHDTLEQLQSEENNIQLRLINEGKAYSSSSATSSPCTFVESSGDHVKNGRAICSDGIDRNRNTRTPNFITGDINKQQRDGSMLEKQRKAGARTLYTSEVKNECHLRTGKTPKTNTSEHKNSQYRAKNPRRRSGRNLRENSKRHEHYHKYHGNMGKETPPGIWSLSPVDS